MNYKRINLYLFSLLILYLAIGLQLKAHLPPFQVHNAARGLISDFVYDIHQDQQGYLWFATEAGLSRYDGYQFTNFTTDDGLPVNEVLDLKEDSQGRLWCMTFPGIPTYYDNGKFIHSREEEWLREAEVPVYFHGFLEDSEGYIWLVGLLGDVIRLDLEKKEVLRIPPKSPYGLAIGLWEDSENQIWLMARGKYYQWNGNEFVEVGILSRDQTLVLREKPDGRVLGGGYGGIIEFKGGKVSELITHPALEEERLNDIFEDENGDLWVATYAGVLRFREVAGEWILLDHILKDILVSRVIRDSEGNYWISTLGKGVYFFPSFDFVSLIPDPDKSPAFFCLTLNDQGEVMAGGNLIWGKVKGKEFELNEIQGIKQNSSKITQIFLHPKGHIFLLSPGGMIRIKPDGTSDLHYVNGKRIGIGPEGTVFLGSKREIFQFGIDEPLPLYFYRDTLFCEEHIVFDKRPFDLVRSPDQRYLSIDNDSIYYFNGKTFVPDRHKLPEGSQFLRKMHFDPKGDMWLLLEGRGVAHLVNDTWHVVEKSHGLSSTLMFSISDGPEGSILIGTQKGLNQIVVKGPGDYEVKTYDKFDGLPSDVIYDALYHRDSIWAATPFGLVGFHAGHIPPHNYDPPIHFTSFSVNNVAVPLDSTLTFPYHQNHIAIGFKGLSYRHGGRLRYRYRILGYGEEWSDTDFPQVEFPQLEPGKYEFEVQPIRRDGQPGEHSATLSFIIHKPFWGTTWFKVVCGLGILLLLVVIFRIRVLTYNRDVVRELFEMAFRKPKPTAFLVVKSNGMKVRIAHPEIQYVEAKGDYVKIVTDDGAHMVHLTMKKLSMDLPESEFIRIHRSYLIRLDKVRAAKGKTALMIGDAELPVGRTYKENVASALESILNP